MRLKRDLWGGFLGSQNIRSSQLLCSRQKVGLGAETKSVNVEILINPTEHPSEEFRAAGTPSMSKKWVSSPALKPISPKLNPKF